MYVSAMQQLHALRAKQHMKRAIVEEHMQLYDTARDAYEMAQRQEAELRAMVHAAEARTAQLRQRFCAVEAELRTATTQLSHTQFLCHSLESRIAEYVGCQRSAVFLAALPSFSILPLSRRPPLCPMDPYSLFNTVTAEALSYDSVDIWTTAASDHSVELYPVGRGENPTVEGGEGVGLSDAETDGRNRECHCLCEEAGACPTSPTIESLFIDAVHDILRGYHYTFLCTSVDGCSLCNSDDDGIPSGMCATRAPSTNGASAGVRVQSCQHNLSFEPAHFCLRVLQLLEQEASRGPTRKLNISLAVGSVGMAEAACTPKAAFTTMTAPPTPPACAATESGWTDLLLPIAARHQQETIPIKASPLDERVEAKQPCMSSDSRGMRFKNSNDINSVASLDSRDMRADGTRSPELSRTAGGLAGQTALTTSVPTLEGVPLTSIEAAAFWLQEAGLLATADTANDPRDTGRLQTSSPPPSSQRRSTTRRTVASSVVVLLVDVHTQDVTGKLHNSLLRIVGDSHFDPGPFGDFKLLSKGLDAPRCCSPSTFSLYMSHTIEALARTAASKSTHATDSELSSPDEREEQYSSTPANSSTVMRALHRSDIAPLSAHEVRTVTHNTSFRCLEETCALTKISDAHDSLLCSTAAAWRLWATLLRSIFGGNSKAMWVHYTSTGYCCSPTNDGSGDRDSLDATNRVFVRGGFHSQRGQRSDTAALRLSALFCRLVRHDAVASEISPELARLTSAYM